MKIITLVLFLIFNTTYIQAQKISVGFRIEPSLVALEKENVFTPYAFYASATYHPIKLLSLELRPGFLFAGENYSGFEVGAFSKLNIIPNNFFLIAGINNHSNLSSGHNGYGTLSTEIFFWAVGIGYQKDEHLSIDLTYHSPTDGVYGYYVQIEPPDIGSIKDTKLKSVLKLGVCLAWDIL